MGRELGIECVVAIANKITESAQIDVIKSHLDDVVLLGALNYSRSLQQADLRRAPVFEADADVIDELKQVKKRLMELIVKVNKIDN